MKFIITVDTEADNQWKGKPFTELENIKHLGRFQNLCETHSFYPTYLLTHEVITDSYAQDFFSTLHKKEAAELGTHLHPWSTPPFDDGDNVQRFPLELSDDVLHKKMKSITEAFKDAFGFSPQSFRAGRWGYDERLGNVLTELGYHVDSSITPKTDWGVQIKNVDLHKRIPNFLNESIFPHMRESGIFEVPMSILYTGWGVRELGVISKRIISMPYIVRRIWNKCIGKPLWCRIYPETKVEDLIRVYRAAQKNELEYLVFMIHSSECMVGGSPYSKKEENLEHMYQVLEAFMIFLKKEGVEGSFLRDSMLV